MPVIFLIIELLLTIVMGGIIAYKLVQRAAPDPPAAEVIEQMGPTGDADIAFQGNVVVFRNYYIFRDAGEQIDWTQLMENHKTLFLLQCAFVSEVEKPGTYIELAELQRFVDEWARGDGRPIKVKMQAF